MPVILEGHYDYLLHLDLSAFSDPERRGEYTLPKRAHVAALARAHPASELFLVRHRSRSRVVEEWNKTVALQLERADLSCGFARAMRAKFGASVVNAAPLFGLGEFVRKVKGAVVVNSVFRDTHRALVSFGMMRDQNVLPLALWNRVAATTDKVMSCDTHRQDEDLAKCVHLAGPGAESRNIQMLGRPLDEPPFTAAAFAWCVRPFTPLQCGTSSRASTARAREPQASARSDVRRRSLRLVMGIVCNFALRLPGPFLLPTKEFVSGPPGAFF